MIKMSDCSNCPYRCGRKMIRDVNGILRTPEEYEQLVRSQIEEANRKVQEVADREFYRTMLDHGYSYSEIEDSLRGRHSVMTLEELWAERKREASPYIFEKLDAEREVEELKAKRSFMSGELTESQAVDALRHAERRYNRRVEDYRRAGY